MDRLPTSSDHFLKEVSDLLVSMFKVPDPTGDSHAFHLVAPGLVAMAHWGDARLDAYLARPMPAATRFSATGLRTMTMMPTDWRITRSTTSMRCGISTTTSGQQAMVPANTLPGRFSLGKRQRY